MDSYWVVLARSLGIVAGAAALSLILGAPLLTLLRRLRARQVVRDDGPATHLVKAGTPVGGGVGIVAAFGLVALIAGPQSYTTRYVVLLALLYGLIGLTDDYAKLAGGSHRGWKARYRMLAEALVALAFLAAVRTATPERASGPEPATAWLCGWPRWVLDVIVIVGSANAVNLTDGLDGLAAGCTALVALGLGAAGAIAAAMQEAVPAALALGGAALGFLWWNARPARMFMGDVGSLSMGAVLGGVAVTAGLELVLAVMGGVFVLEALSVMAQVASFQTTGRRVLRMAPFHHHLELGGWPETRVVHALWVATAALVAVGLAISPWLVLPA